VCQIFRRTMILMSIWKSAGVRSAGGWSWPPKGGTTNFHASASIFVGGGLDRGWSRLVKVSQGDDAAGQEVGEFGGAFQEGSKRIQVNQSESGVERVGSSGRLKAELQTAPRPGVRSMQARSADRWAVKVDQGCSSWISSLPPPAPPSESAAAAAHSKTQACFGGVESRRIQVNQSESGVERVGGMGRLKAELRTGGVRAFHGAGATEAVKASQGRSRRVFSVLLAWDASS
jgi:hypothetical protein